MDQQNPHLPAFARGLADPFDWHRNHHHPNFLLWGRATNFKLGVLLQASAGFLPQRQRHRKCLYSPQTLKMVPCAGYYTFYNVIAFREQIAIFLKISSVLFFPCCQFFALYRHPDTPVYQFTPCGETLPFIFLTPAYPVPRCYFHFFAQIGNNWSFLFTIGPFWRWYHQSGDGLQNPRPISYEMRYPTDIFLYSHSPKFDVDGWILISSTDRIGPVFARCTPYVVRHRFHLLASLPCIA